MQINVLLEELINIAKKPKTDFAISMNMTPSGLSKILTGKRLPTLKERKLFTKLAADYFAEAIYSQGCYFKFKNMFPIIYDFESKNDLQLFLTCALEYSLDNAFASENNINLDYSERGMYYFGRKSVLNLLCVILSDQILSATDAALELFSTLPFFDPAYEKIFKKMIVVNPNKLKNTVFHHFYDETALFNQKKRYGYKLLSFIVWIQKISDLNLWKMNTATDLPFLLLKGKLLMLFHTQIDGTPLLIPIVHKSYLTIFYNCLTKKDVKRISYSTNEIIEVLNTNPAFANDLLKRTIETVYCLTPIGYLLEKNELLNTQDDKKLGEIIWEMLSKSLTKETVFYFSASMLEQFVSMGKVIVPLLGTVYFSQDQRAAYLQRFNTYLEQNNHENYKKVKIIDLDLANIAVIQSEEFCLIYTVNDNFEREKFHLIETHMLHHLLSSEKEHDLTHILDISPDLWRSYQNELKISGLSF